MPPLRAWSASATRYGGVLAVDGGRGTSPTSAEREPVEADVGDGVGRRSSRGSSVGERVAAGELVGPVGADEQRGGRGRGSASRSNTAMLSESAQWRSSNTRTARAAGDGVVAAGSTATPEAVGERATGAVAVGGGGAARRCVGGRRRSVGGGVEEELERVAEAAGLGLAGQHEDHGSGSVAASSSHEPGLADAGLAADQHRSPGPGTRAARGGRAGPPGRPSRG